MFVPFHNLPGSSRIWIYQSDRAITFDEEKILSDILKTFCQQWMVHGEPMDTSFEIRHSRFIILAANDQASGCSIDSSVRVIKEAGSKTGIDFFNRNLVTFRDSEEIRSIPISSLREALSRGDWTISTLMFNNLVDSKEALETSWLIPAQASWLNRYLPHQPVSR